MFILGSEELNGSLTVCYPAAACSRGQLHFSCQNRQRRVLYRLLATSRRPSTLSFDQSQLMK